MTHAKDSNELDGLETLEGMPEPISPMESMRSIGHYVDAAIADMIDNSVSAGTRDIEVHHDASNAHYLAILDNGSGMNPKQLTNPVRHGNKNPADQMRHQDLGRFGLVRTIMCSSATRLSSSYRLKIQFLH